MKHRNRRPRRYVSEKTGLVSWRVRYRDTDGRERSETFYDETAAEEFAGLVNTLGPTRALAYIDDRLDGDDGPTLTVDALFEKWIEWKGARDKRGELRRVKSERTILDYRRMYRSHIKAAFGTTPANLVSPTDVQVWIDNLDLSPKTVADYHALLHGMYKWGIHPSRGLVVVDPCESTELPARRKKPPKGLRPLEWQILHQAARDVDKDAADLLLFMASTGWRWSEAVACQVKDVDHWIDEQGTSRTFVTMGRVLRREGNTYAFVDDAKSEAGMRRVRLVGESERMVLDRIYGKGPNDLILTTKQGNRWWYNSFHTRFWKRPEKGPDPAPKRKRILERAKELGLDRPDITLHWTRHTQAFMLILAGEPLPAIQRRLGHASIKTTVDVYGKMVEDASDAGLDRLAVMLGSSKKPRIES